MPQPTNEVLSAKIDALCEKFDTGIAHMTGALTEIKDHVKETNGHVGRNTKFRLKVEESLKKHLLEVEKDKNAKLKRYADLFWKIAVAVAAIVFGIEKFIL